MIPGLPQVGPTELLIILAVILLFFGAKRIPELARSLGRGTREFRQGISEGASTEEATDGQEKDQGKAPLRATGDDEMSRAEAEQTVAFEHKS